MCSRNGVDVDVLCACGVDKGGTGGYYDLFATVLLPDTFVLDLGGRSVQARPEENSSLINGPFFSHSDLLEWFKKEGGDTANPVPVRSCFGGLALYRASKWLDQNCSYMNPHPEINAKYGATWAEGLPCEHVVFHNCLQSVDPKVVVAVKPDLQTVWKSYEAPQYAVSYHPDLVMALLANFSDVHGLANSLLHKMWNSIDSGYLGNILFTS